jgi:hypothetical protein
MGDADMRPSMRRRARIRNRKTGRVRGARLAALAGVSAVLLLPQPTQAQVVGAADDTPPVVTYSIDGIVGTNGWYRGNMAGDFVVVKWLESDPESTITSTTGCEPALNIPGPVSGVTKTCSATSAGGTTTITTKAISIDATPPAVTAAAARAADSNGWYNKPVGISFAGTDATSGIASCSSSTYAGPDSASAPVSGTCTDVAGNVGSATLALAYDATPPQLLKLSSKPTKRGVVLDWAASADTQRVEVTRSPGKSPKSVAVVYSGTAKTFPDKGLRVGKKYRYTVSAFDAAGNQAGRTIKVTATGALLTPAPGEQVTARPRLTWTPTRGASYYNVQLIRGGTILSVWPRTTSLTLPRSWVFHGHRYRLHRGVYRWYVWPGFGRLTAARYGDLVGRSSFLFAR